MLIVASLHVNHSFVAANKREGGGIIVAKKMPPSRV